MMKRSQFIKQCGLACTSASVLVTWLQSCGTQKIATVAYDNEKLVLPLTEFYTIKNGDKKWNRVLIVRNEKVAFPVVVYRLKENDYRAFLLRCTHQGNELNVYGDLITCSAHGSEFSNNGQVLQGPADSPLQSYKVIADDKTVYIHL